MEGKTEYEDLKSKLKKIEEVHQEEYEEALRLYHCLEWEKMLERNKKARIKEQRKKAMDEGRKIGMDEGRKKASIEVATNMKNMGMPIQDIVEITELSEEFIEKL